MLHIFMLFVVCMRFITMPDVLMIVAMATSFHSERKILLERAGRGGRGGEEVKRGWTGELGGQNRNIFFMRQML